MGNSSSSSKGSYLRIRLDCDDHVSTLTTTCSLLNKSDDDPEQQHLVQPTSLYVAGDTVRGFAAVNIRKIQQKFLHGKKQEELPKTNFHLVLQIIGKERCKITGGSSSSSTAAASFSATVRKSERILLFNETTLYEFRPEEVAKWTSTWQDFSFSFKIPSQLPSSLRCDSFGGSGRRAGRGGRSSSSYAEVGYKVKALLEPVGVKDTGNDGTTNKNNKTVNTTSTTLGGRMVKTFSKGRSNMQLIKRGSSSNVLEAQSVVQERSIQIRASPIPPAIVPCMIEPTIHEVKTFGVKSQGRVIFGVYVTDTHLGPGEILEVIFACRNHSTVDVKKVYLKLVETVVWNVETTSGSFKRKLRQSQSSTSLTLQKTVERTLSYQEETMEVLAKPADQIWYERYVESDINEFQDSFVHIHGQLQARHHVFKLQMPVDDSNANAPHDSYCGPLVKCTHHCEVTVKTEDHVDDPKVIIPLNLKQFVPWDIYNAGSCGSLNGNINDETSSDANNEPTRGGGASDDDGTSQVSSTVQLGTIQDEEGIDDEEGKEGANDRNPPFRFESFGEESVPSRQMPTVEDVFGTANDGGNVDEGDIVDSESAMRRPSIVPVEVPLESMVTGGRVRELQLQGESSSSLSGGSWLNERDMSELFQQEGDNDDMDPIDGFPTFEKVLDEMLVSVDDLDIIERKLQDPEWRPILVHVSAEEYGLIIGHVNKEHDQPTVAVAIASAMFADSLSGVIFTCEHIVKAVQMAADWTRTSIVQNLLPYCCDLVESRKHLTEILTPWELTVLHAGKFPQ